MGLASELPGLREDILDLYSALYASMHICAEHDLSARSQNTVALCYMEGFESRVFGGLLSVAVKMRSFFDAKIDNENLDDFIAHLNDRAVWQPCCIQLSPQEKDLDVREACNKIIHSLSAQMVHGTISSRKFDPPSEFSNRVPTEEVILKGAYFNKNWECKLNIQQFCIQSFELFNEYDFGTFA